MRGAAAPGRLRHRVGEFIAQNRLWSPGQQVAVACSGGLDSVVLLDVCVPLLREFLLQHQVVLLQAQVVALSLAAEMLIVCQSLLDVHSLLIASD